ncbi:hypothetical protein FRC02_002705 [Tulasnella sp. 418]|nr:hypothetical protein FRC02_002705 [Tulasnella sp. 418]
MSSQSPLTPFVFGDLPVLKQDIAVSDEHFSPKNALGITLENDGAKKNPTYSARCPVWEMESAVTRDESGLFSDEDEDKVLVISIGKRTSEASDPLPLVKEEEFILDPLEATTMEIPVLWGTNDGLLVCKRGSRGKNADGGTRKVSELFKQRNKTGYIMVRTPNMAPSDRVKVEIGLPMAQEIYNRLQSGAGLSAATGPDLSNGVNVEKFEGEQDDGEQDDE